MMYDDEGRETYLDTAARIIHGARNVEYGHPAEDFQRIAGMWSAFLGIEVTPKQVAALMVLLKCGRLAHNIDHEDSWIDMAGYVGCADRIQRLADGLEGGAEDLAGMHPLSTGSLSEELFTPAAQARLSTFNELIADANASERYASIHFNVVVRDAVLRTSISSDRYDHRVVRVEQIDDRDLWFLLWDDGWVSIHNGLGHEKTCVDKDALPSDEFREHQQQLSPLGPTFKDGGPWPK